MNWSQRTVFIAVAIVTGFYYEWGVRATGFEFQWRTDLDGYYNLLTRGFAAGHLYLPLEPDPKLLALPNPLDGNAGQDLPKLFDAVLYERHYYLYHGAGPAVMLFLPWRLASGHDLPEGFALFLFSFGGYLFAAGTLLLMLRMAAVEARPWTLALLLLALGFCQSVPFLLSRVWVYEIAIGSGYFCVASGLFFLVLALQSARLIWPAASGLMLAMAVACRPHLGVVAGMGLIAMGLAGRRRAIAFATPLLLLGTAIGMYNFERFGNPFDFGIGYQITGPNQGTLHPRLVNVLPGLYYLLFTKPDFTGVFPWVLKAWPPRSFPRPPEYLVEPAIGALFLAPFLPMAIATLFMPRFRGMRWITVVSGLLILGFLATTGWSTQRYEVDFLPMLVLASMAGFGVWLARAKGGRRSIAASLLVATVTFGVVVNLALGIAGPYDELMKNKPARYVSIAKWFSPVAHLRPALNPPVAADFAAPIKAEPDHVRDDLFSAGRQPWQYELFVDHLNGSPLLISRFGSSDIRKPIPPSATPLPFHVVYAPLTREMVVSVSGAETIRHKLDALVAAPAQVVVR